MNTTSSERSLIEGCQKGDREAQTSLYHQFKGQVFRTCTYYMHSHADAEDLFQEAFIQIFKDLYQYSGKGSLKGWIQRVTVNKALQFLRKRKIRFDEIDEVNETIEWQTKDEDAVDRLSGMEIIELIKGIPLGYRTVFNLYVIEGYSHQEIAEQLQIGVSTSKSQLSRAKQLLRGLLTERNKSEVKLARS